MHEIDENGPPYRIELPEIFGMRSVNCYLFVEPEPVLIDCGEHTEASWKALIDGLALRGVEISDLQRVIITHAHVDHIGQAGLIAANSDAQIWVNSPTAPWALEPQQMWQRRAIFFDRQMASAGISKTERKMMLGIMQMISNHWQPVPRSRIQVYPTKGVLQIAGDPWEIIYTPGHTRTQVCFHQAPTRRFISADMLLPLAPVPISEEDPGTPGGRTRALVELINSYHLVDLLEIDIVYPGHGRPFRNPGEVIRAQLKRIDQRKEECFQLIRSGLRSFVSILDTMYPEMKGPARMPAIGMLSGYLDLLITEGRIKQQQIGDEIGYDVSSET